MPSFSKRQGDFIYMSTERLMTEDFYRTYVSTEGKTFVFFVNVHESVQESYQVSVTFVDYKEFPQGALCSLTLPNAFATQKEALRFVENENEAILDGFGHGPFREEVPLTE